MKKLYEDILYCKRPVSKNHPPMSRESRAAQFGSFAALSGYEEAVNEAGRLTDQKIELDENAKEKLDWQIHILQTQMAKNPEVEVVYFVPDPRKEGGRYERLKGVLQKVDLYKKEMFFSGNRIAMEHILELKSPLFEKTETGDW